MTKWIVLCWHRLTSVTVGGYIEKAAVVIEAELNAAMQRARMYWMIDNAKCHRVKMAAMRAYSRDMEALDVLGAFELAAIEHEVELLHARAGALLDSGVNLAERTIDALCLHAHLANAVEKASPAVKPPAPKPLAFAVDSVPPKAMSGKL